MGLDKTCKITDFGLALIRDKYQYLYCTSIRKVSSKLIDKYVCISVPLEGALSLSCHNLYSDPDFPPSEKSARSPLMTLMPVYVTGSPANQMDGS